MFPEQIVSEELKYVAILGYSNRAMLEMKTAFACLYRSMRIYLFYKTQNPLLKEQGVIGSTFGGHINASSKIQKVNGD